MNVLSVPISRIFKSYLGQARIAELNSKNPIIRVQTQRDRVSISQEARAALASHVSEAPALQTEAVEVGENEGSETQVSADESFSRTNFAE